MADGRQEQLPAAVAEAGRWFDDALTDSLGRLVAALREAPSEAAPEAPAATAAPRPGAAPAAATRAIAAPARAAAETLTALMAELVPRVLERLDLDAVLSRVDVDALVARIDLDRVLDGMDPDRLLARVDVDDLVRRVDAAALTREALEGVDMGEIIRESTTSLGSDTVEAVRVQGMEIDQAVARFVDRVLGRRRGRDTALDGGAAGPW